MNAHKKFIKCQKSGMAQHYGGCLWLCRRPLCEDIQHYGGSKYCKVPIRDEIVKNREKEMEAKNDVG